MIKRMRQNRSLRASNRQKFKGDNRQNIYSETERQDRAIFEEFPESQVKEAITQIRNKAKSKRRRERILLGIIGVVVAIIIIYALYPSKGHFVYPQVKSQNIVQKISKPIVWSGKLSEPLKIPFSNLFYIPMVGNLDYVDLNRTYEMSSYNMVVEYTSNILFLDKECFILRKLLPENGSITYMAVGPHNEELKPKKIVYLLARDEPNTYGKIYNLEKHFLYISEIDGKNLTKITEREFISYQWVNEGKAIQVNFYYKKKMNDSIHGLFNIETNEFKLSSHLKEK
ncbi:hypothetical protein OO010_06940 [Flavobacteriaceae bacterium KMM 6898]|nr:hypothetical protein [Flavobacteriaceae bacterium KMM 6898]